MDYTRLGKRIKEKRLRLNLTQEKLSEKVGISTAYLGQIERGERCITLDKLIPLANYLGGVTVDFLLTDYIVTDEDNNLNILRQHFLIGANITLSSIRVTEYIIVRGVFPVGQVFFQDHFQGRSHRHDLSLAVLTLVQLNHFILKIKVFDLKAQNRRDTVSSRQKIVGEHPGLIFVELAGFYIRLFEKFLQFGIRVGFLDTLIRFGEFDFEALEIPFFHQIIAETAHSPHIGLNRDVVTAPVLKIEDKAL